MPGWHDATRQARESGAIQTIGIIQEQHPDRCRLFMQWKQMDWPVLVDSYNLLGVAVVPITLLVDEQGIIRAVNPKMGDLSAFESSPSAAGSKQALALTETDQVAITAEGSTLNRTIEAYQSLLEDQPGNGPLHFRLGVALRKRFDSEHRRPGDFQQAVDEWGRALEIDPNQYIWRRRIQQYGPRLAKPYSFYDWVRQARADIGSRGEQPEPLLVEPSGAEFADPRAETEHSLESSGEPQNPDPNGRIHRDREGFVQLETAVVPHIGQAGEPLRVHLDFRPNSALDAHWNNEAEDMLVWLDPPTDWSVDRKLVRVKIPSTAVSLEPRRVEFEVTGPPDFKGLQQIPFYALYYVCEGVKGTCLFRRQDGTASITVR